MDAGGMKPPGQVLRAERGVVERLRGLRGGEPHGGGGRMGAIRWWESSRARRPLIRPHPEAGHPTASLPGQIWHLGTLGVAFDTA